MGLNREGYVLLALFVYLLVLLFSGFRLYGRSDGEPRGGTEGRLADALAYFGAGPLPLLLMGLPGLLLLDGWPRLAAGLSLALGCCLLPLLGGSIGALLGMRTFRHKTKHWYFVWGIPAILLAQIVLAVWLLYR